MPLKVPKIVENCCKFSTAQYAPHLGINLAVDFILMTELFNMSNIFLNIIKFCQKQTNCYAEDAVTVVSKSLRPTSNILGLM